VTRRSAIQPSDAGKRATQIALARSAVERDLSADAQLSFAGLEP
jgi:hypothetical protein